MQKVVGSNPIIRFSFVVVSFFSRSLSVFLLSFTAVAQRSATSARWS